MRADLSGSHKGVQRSTLAVPDRMQFRFHAIPVSTNQPVAHPFFAPGLGHPAMCFEIGGVDHHFVRLAMIQPRRKSMKLERPYLGFGVG